MRHLAIIVLAGLCGAGCANHALKRWASAPAQDSWSRPSLNVTSAPADPSDGLTVDTLPDHAAGAYVTALAAKLKDPAKLRDALAAPIKKDAPAGSEVQTSVSRVFIVDVERDRFRPADRYTKLKIEMIPVGFVFSGFQAAATSTASLNIGSVSIADSKTGGLTLSPTLASGETFGSASYQATRTDTTSRNITDQAQLSIIPSEDRLTIYRKGAEGTDLTGSTLVKMTVQFLDSETSGYGVASIKLFDKKGRVLVPNKAELSVRRLTTVAPTDAYVCARVAYQERIAQDAKYYDEGRQTIQVKEDTTPWEPFMVVPRRDMQQHMWIIQRSGRSAALVADNGLQSATLVFTDIDSATQFAHWLARFKVLKVGAYRLYEGAQGLGPHTGAEFSQLQPRLLPQMQLEGSANSQVPSAQLIERSHKPVYMANKTKTVAH